MQALLASANRFSRHSLSTDDLPVIFTSNMKPSIVASTEDRSDPITPTSSDRNTESFVEAKVDTESNTKVDFEGKRKRVERACLNCRKRRIKCDGAEPKCEACTNLQSECNYPPPTQKLTIKNFEALQRRIDELESKLSHTTRGTSSSRTSRSAPEPTYSSTFTQSQSCSTSRPIDIAVSSSYDNFQEPSDPSTTAQFYNVPSASRSVGAQTEFSDIAQLERNSQSYESTTAMKEFKIWTSSERTLRGAQLEAEFDFEEFLATNSRMSQESEPVPSVANFGDYTQIEPIFGNEIEYESDALDPDLYGFPSCHEVAAMLEVYHKKLHFAFPVFDMDPIYQMYSKPSVQSSRQQLDSSDNLHLAMLNRILSIVVACRGQDSDMKEAEVLSTRSLRLAERINIFSAVKLEVVQYFLLSCYYYSEICPNVSKINVAREHIILSSFLVHSLQLDLPLPGDVSRTDRKASCDILRAAHMCMAVQLASMLNEPDLIKGCRLISEPESLVSSSFPPSIWSTVASTGNLDCLQQHTFFVENTKLCNLKRTTITKLYTSFDISWTFGIMTDVVTLKEELSSWWTQLPSFLRNFKVDSPISTPLDRLSAFQSGLLQCKFIETSTMFYRPCLVGHLLGQEVPPSSSGHTLANLSVYCAEAALALINTVFKTWDTILRGFWWYLMGLVYSSSLILLAFRTTQVNLLDPRYEHIQIRSFETIQDVIGFFSRIVMYNPSAMSESIMCPIPSEDVRSMARRCISLLDKLSKVCKPRMEGPMRLKELPLELRDTKASFEDDCFVADWIQKVIFDRTNHGFTNHFNEKFVATYGHRLSSTPAPLGWRLLLGSGFFSTFKSPSH